MSEFLYKFACFDCRVAFKRRATENPSTGSAHQAEAEISHSCPNCDHRMAFLGRNFAAPPKQDASGWLAAKKLWESGYRYSGSGSHADPALPQKKADVASFVNKNPSHAQKIGIAQLWSNYA